MHYIMRSWFYYYYYYFSDLYLVVPSVLCLPLITISTLILFVKICLKPEQIKRLLTCFIGTISGLDMYFNLGASLNSSINPVIYFWFGERKELYLGEHQGTSILKEEIIGAL
ncbi:hypothetical protein E2320_011745 [Naja naja]|nr:hypothetical protein E2320_011745 [Naja naja]